MPQTFTLGSTPTPPPPLRAPAWSCRRFEAPGAVRLAVAGGLDRASAPRLDRALRDAQADAPVVVLDLRRLEFVGSSGGHVILAAELRARAAGDRLAVVRGPAELAPALELTGGDPGLWLADLLLVPTG